MTGFIINTLSGEIDFCLALVGLIIAAIPMAIVAVAIKAEIKRSCDL